MHIDFENMKSCYLFFVHSYKESIMKLYAIKVHEDNLELITLLNSGSTPEVEQPTGTFVFDATWNSDVPNEIVTFDELVERFEITDNSPMVQLTSK